MKPRALLLGGMTMTWAAAFSASGMSGSLGAEKPIVISVTNHRAVALRELHAAVAGGPAISLLKRLPPGSNAVIRFPHGASCIYEVHATFEDGAYSDFRHFDLCEDETINLVDEH